MKNPRKVFQYRNMDLEHASFFFCDFCRFNFIMCGAYNATIKTHFGIASWLEAI